MFLTASIIVFVIYFANVAMGAFAGSAFLGDVFYFAGTFGMGFALIPARPLLLCNQTILLGNRKHG